MVSPFYKIAINLPSVLSLLKVIFTLVKLLSKLCMQVYLIGKDPEEYKIIATFLSNLLKKNCKS